MSARQLGTENEEKGAREGTAAQLHCLLSKLFLDPEKQRNRIAFHLPCNYVVSPPNVVLEDSLHLFVAMFRPNLK